MSNVLEFQGIVTELLAHIGLNIATVPVDQDLFSLSVDDSYTLHLGMMNDDIWFILAELNSAVSADAPISDWLQRNRLNDQALQPVIALDNMARPCCYLRMQMSNHDLPEILNAFDATLACADYLCGKGE